ncbi:MAG: hypothetical protein K2L07_14690 [Lachnospiraceae bacterium]|nr:hypothetical protein [Lachnospiraceae bacterium]
MAKKKSTFGKLLAFTTVAAAIGGTCYIFRDKIKTCPLYQKASNKLCNLKNSVSDKFCENDDFCFDDDDFEDASEDIFADNDHGREYTSITINPKEQTPESTAAEDTEIPDTVKAHTTADSEEIPNTAGVHNTAAEDTEIADTADNTEIPDTTEFHSVADDLGSSNDSSGEEEVTLPDEDMTEITSDTDATEKNDSLETTKESDIPVLEEVIPTISFNNPFDSSKNVVEDDPEENTTTEVTGYENEGLSDVSEDPDVLEEQDKLDF